MRKYPQLRGMGVYSIAKVNKIEQAKLVAECRSSGMTAKEWCQSKGIDYRRYIAWASKQNREEENAVRQWAGVTMPKEAPVSDEIKLACGRWTICVNKEFSAELLGDVLRVVNAVC